MSTPTSARQSRPARRRQLSPRRRLLDQLSLLALLSAVLLIVAASLFNMHGLRTPRRVDAATAGGVTLLPPEPTPATEAALVAMPTASARPTGTAEPTGTAPPTRAPTETSTPPPPTQTAPPTATLPPTFTAIPRPQTIALIVGHRNNDSGAICEEGAYEGLHEVHVTTEIAARLRRLLIGRGYEVIDLDEFDSRLNGLEADALISIHVDSCVDWEGTTGYKVARASNSAIPEVEDEFVACMNEEYSAATGLTIHTGSITHDMTAYHAFRRVSQTTPAVIIELGFLYHDHDLLTERQGVVTEGLYRGLMCFLEE